MVFDRIRSWRRRRAVEQMRVSDELWRQVEAGLPFLDYLPPQDRPRLRELALHFLAGKELAGANGFDPSDDIKLAIALQACLPILNLGIEFYDGWVGVLVYPSDFVIPRRETDAAGVVHEYDDTVAGEAWTGGPVLLSWQRDGHDAGRMNVVIHEFAHKLDMLNGSVDGLPPLPEGMSRRAWAAAMSAAYEDFCRRVDAREHTALDPYAAEHPSEFFAVMSEAFFETPLLLKREYPAVYQQLRAFYRQDPALRAQALAVSAPGSAPP